MPFRVRVEHLVLVPAVPCGMDFGEVGGKLKRLRTTTEDDHPSIVRRRPGLPEPYWELADGRHRYFAAVIAGRPDLLVEEERSAQEAEHGAGEVAPREAWAESPAP